MVLEIFIVHRRSASLLRADTLRERDNIVIFSEASYALVGPVAKKPKKKVK